jgi:hypothetical protein
MTFRYKSFFKYLTFIAAVVVAIIDVIMISSDAVEPFVRNLLMLNVIVVLLFAKTPEFFIYIIEKMIRKRRFERNRELCIHSGKRYVNFFRELEYSEDHDIGIVTIIERAVENYCTKKEIANIEQKTGIRIVVYHNIVEHLQNSSKKDVVDLHFRNILSQYNFRSKGQKVDNILRTIANELGYGGKPYWRRKTLGFISKIVPTIQLLLLEQRLNQLTRFKDFLKDKFSTRFASSVILNKIMEESKKNCYWVIAKNIDSSVRGYLVKLPIFATKPANNHNFPGLRSLRFSHYLIRIEDPTIKSVQDFKDRLQSIMSPNSKMILFILPIHSSNMKTIIPKQRLSEKQKHNLEVIQSTILYFATGIVDVPLNTSY